MQRPMNELAVIQDRMSPALKLLSLGRLIGYLPPKAFALGLEPRVPCQGDPFGIPLTPNGERGSRIAQAA